jgi:hypothetical protein
MSQLTLHLHLKNVRAMSRSSAKAAFVSKPGVCSLGRHSRRDVSHRIENPLLGVPSLDHATTVKAEVQPTT